MPNITPCLWFDGQAEEAAELYCSVFPNSKINEVQRYPEGLPGEPGSVMVVEFELDGTHFTGLNGGPLFKFNEAVSFQIACADQDEVDHYWDKLTDGGGKEGQCGWLADRFGLSWQVVPTRLSELFGSCGPEEGKRLSEAMLKMSKLDIAELEAAAAG